MGANGGGGAVTQPARMDGEVAEMERKREKRNREKERKIWELRWHPVYSARQTH